MTATQGAGSVDLHVDGKIAVVTLRRGENLLNFEMFEAFNHALDEAERNPNIAVLVTTAEGKFFSHGIDQRYMKMAEEWAPEKVKIFIMGYYGLLIRILTFPMPTIAAINGHAFAEGAMLALAHDYLVMQSEKGWLCFNEVHMDSRFAPFSFTMLRAKLTPAQLTEAGIFGRRYTASEAKASGIVEHVAPPGKLMEITKEFASVFISVPIPYKRQSVLNMKNDMYGEVLKEKLNLTNGIFAKL